MKVIAVTGGIGTGKSTVSREFKKLGATVISADAVSRDIMKKGGIAYTKVVESFGRGILFEDGEINRKALGAIVFSDAESLKLLNSITHSLIYKEIKKRTEAAETELVCLEIPLLYDGEIDKSLIKTDAEIAVIADREERIKRVIGRDGCTRQTAIDRMNSQLSDEEYARYADFVLENNGDLYELPSRVRDLYNKIMQK